MTGNAANRVVVYPRVDYPLCWCCVAGSLGVKSRGGLIEGGTAGATVNVGAVMDGLDDVSKDSAVCVILLSTYEVSGNRESSAQAEDAEDDNKEQHDCGALGGEGHGGSVVVVGGRD